MHTRDRVRRNGDTTLPSPRTLRKRLLDPCFLPTRAELEHAFSTKDRYDEFNGAESALEDFARRDYAWNKFVEKVPVFEMFHKEYIDALALYLTERICMIRTSIDHPVVILEVGAGNGRLTHFLREALAPHVREEAQLRACDNGSWKSVVPFFPVEYIDYREALDVHHPDIVISAWMPPQVDFTSDFRARGVREYLLIGDMECCGDIFDSWGVSHGDSGCFPFQTDGYERIELDHLTALQINRNNWPSHWGCDDMGNWSHTVVFRKT